MHPWVTEKIDVIYVQGSSNQFGYGSGLYNTRGSTRNAKNTDRDLETPIATVVSIELHGYQ